MTQGDAGLTDFRHKNGLWWHEAPLPRRRHRCQVQSSGTLPSGTFIERCACGAARLDGILWIERNSRRKERSR